MSRAIEVEVLSEAAAVAARAAAVVAEAAWESIAARGTFVMAVSGGRTPWMMLRELAATNIPWKAVHIFQVDERVAPTGHADRNLTHLREALLPHAAFPADQIYAMPVESCDLEAACEQYASQVRQLAGAPCVLDLVHLGLGPDGHTASMVPGDPVLQVEDADVAMSGVYQGRRRMTLTYPVLNRARSVLWVVTGGEKAEMVDRLRQGDRSIPAGRVNSERALVIADREAAGQGQQIAAGFALPSQKGSRCA